MQQLCEFHLEDDFDVGNCDEDDDDDYDETDDVALMIRRIVRRCTMCATSLGARVASRRSYGFPPNSRFPPLSSTSIAQHSAMYTHWRFA